jgi:hypothetical protein
MAMEPKLKAKWTKALCSKRYKQTSGRLCDSDGFCCLGVLCVVSRKAKQLDKSFDFNGKMVTHDLDDDESAIYKQFGLTPRQHEKLVTMNDTEGKTFPEIAAWIEKNIKEKK